MSAEWFIVGYLLVAAALFAASVHSFRVQARTDRRYAEFMQDRVAFVLIVAIVCIAWVFTLKLLAQHWSERHGGEG